MHYKNGRPVSIGDWVVGISHNSKTAICGIVTDLMPEQGPCNIKLHRWEPEQTYNEGIPDRPVAAHETRGKPDYGDAEKFIRVDDGLRMVSAVLGHGNWDGPYL